jgi:hypothetical protein
VRSPTIYTLVQSVQDTSRPRKTPKVASASPELHGPASVREVPLVRNETVPNHLRAVYKTDGRTMVVAAASLPIDVAVTSHREKTESANRILS